MECPAQMEAHLTELERLIDHTKAVRLHIRGDGALALVGDDQIAAKLHALAAGIEGKRPHLLRYRLQGHPGGDGAIAADGPIVLVRVRRSDAPAGLLVERLIVVQPYASDLEQCRGDLGEAAAEDELAHALAALPEVHHLQESAIVRTALLHGQRLGIERDGQSRDFLAIVRELRGVEYVLELDEAIAAERFHLLARHGIVPRKVDLHCCLSVPGPSCTTTRPWGGTSRLNLPSRTPIRSGAAGRAAWRSARTCAWLGYAGRPIALNARMTLP